MGLIDEGNQFKDPITGRSMTLLEGIGAGYIDVDLKSIRDVHEGCYLTLPAAISRGVIHIDGSFKDTDTGDMMSLGEAVKKGFLTTVCLKSIFTIEGIKDQTTGDYFRDN